MNSKESKALILSEIEIKTQIHEKKHLLKVAWSSLSEISKQEDAIEVPQNFCSYTIQDRSIILQNPKREKPKTLCVSYIGLDDAKKVDLADLEETPRLIWINADLSIEEEELLVSTLKEYCDVFAWSYKDIKGVDPKICHHTIPTKDDAKPSRQRPYTYHESFSNKIKEDIDKILEAKFIYEVEHTKGVSLIFIVTKTNGKL